MPDAQSTENEEYFMKKQVNIQVSARPHPYIKTE